ncbi:MAG: cobyrinate a,c-diamide synthase [Spirochaetaceae bacterium]|jgi:cobyrinic acid a,c-diamide synthase|nr:cobyrinate a,c-diamide synthase [Spirochaetaceae bacterium]
MNSVPRLLITASSSGGGKTTLTCALLAAFSARGLKTAAFKCGPDYIDPLFHREICGTPSSNLDLFMLGEAAALSLFEHRARDADIAVIEGAMGFYDGIGASSRASAWEAACLTQTPAVLIEDCRASALTVAARLMGLIRFREPQLVRGIILNNCGESLFLELKKAIETETGVKVYGFLPFMRDCHIKSRHLGLVTPDETSELHKKIAAAAAQIKQSVDLDALIELAREAVSENSQFGRIFALRAKTGLSAPIAGAMDGAGTVQGRKAALGAFLPKAEMPSSKIGTRPIFEPIPLQSLARLQTVAVARDKAFCFYYEDALSLLVEMGAELRFFSPLAGETLPPDARGLYLGGGYPELYAKELSANAALRREIRQAVQDGLPCIAECGGFMYLHDTLFDGEGRAWPMCGAVSGACRKTEKLIRFGYAAYTALHDNLLCGAGEILRGHEFHYWESDDSGADFIAEKPSTGATWNAIIARGNLFAGFPHFHLCGKPEAARCFLQRCVDYAA